MKHTALSSFFVVIFSLVTLTNHSLASDSPPPIQLATKYLPSIKITHYWVSEKLDGMRGYWTGTKLLSKQGKEINVPDWFTLNWPKTAIDGELWIGRGKFQATISCIRRKKINNKCWHNIKFMIFDLPENTNNFTRRINTMKSLVKEYSSPFLDSIKQFKITSTEALENKLAYIINNGGEGLMLHHQEAYYTKGRNQHLMKLKRYQDAEARVIEHLAGKGKYQGMLGAIVVVTPVGIKFKIGSGFTDQQRSVPPPIGSIITYKYTGKTQRGVPRFASFLRIREYH